MGLTMYDPQRPHWNLRFLPLEAQAKANSDYMLYVISSTSRGIAAMVEVSWPFFLIHYSMLFLWEVFDTITGNFEKPFIKVRVSHESFMLKAEQSVSTRNNDNDRLYVEASWALDTVFLKYIIRCPFLLPHISLDPSVYSHPILQPFPVGSGASVRPVRLHDPKLV